LNTKIDEVSRHLTSYLEKVADKLDTKYSLMIQKAEAENSQASAFSQDCQVQIDRCLQKVEGV
jgi:hypothetical protein